MADIMRKTVAGHLVKGADDEGVLEAIVSVYGNVDSYKERCVFGCFNKSISAKLPKGVWMHDWTNPIAKTIMAKELAPGDEMLPESLKELGGLYIKAEFDKDIVDSWQAYLKVKRGYVDEYSIGYRNVRTAKDEDEGVTDLLELDLFEWSPVLVGANRATATLSIKQDLMDGPVGMSIEEHTELLLKRIEQRFADRDSAGSLTDGFVNRLRETGDKIIGIAEQAKARDAEAPAMTKGAALEWAALRHAQRMRDIRQGVETS